MSDRSLQDHAQFQPRYPIEFCLSAFPTPLSWNRVLPCTRQESEPVIAASLRHPPDAGTAGSGAGLPHDCLLVRRDRG